MVLLAHYDRIEKDPSSLNSSFARSAESNDYLAKLLPFAGSLQKYSELKQR